MTNKTCKFCSNYNFAEAFINYDKDKPHILTDILRPRTSPINQFNYCPVCGRPNVEKYREEIDKIKLIIYNIPLGENGKIYGDVYSDVFFENIAKGLVLNGVVVKKD